MHKDVQRRYRSVEALIRDIDHYLKGEPLEARPDTWGYRLSKFVGRNRRAVGATAAVVTVVAALVIFFTVRLAIAKNTAIAAVVRAQRVQEFMLNLVEGGDKSVGPAGDLRVVTIIDRGVKEAQTLRREPAVQAALYMTLGGVYQRLGNLTQADSLLTAALKQREAVFGPENPEVAESLIALGLLRVDQARLREAEQFVRQGLDITHRIRPQNDASLARATTALGKVLEAEGSYDKAIPVLRQAMEIESRLAPQSQDLADAIKELADTQFYAGHYSECENLTRQALAIHRRQFGEKHPLVADDLINLGAVQFERGHYTDAEQFYRQALLIHQAWYGKDNPATASTLSMLGRALVFENRFDEALDLMHRSLAIQERAYGPSHPRVANILNELGNIAIQRKQLDEAERQFRRVADIYKTAYGEHHYRYALALSNLATVYLEHKEYVRAEGMYRQVIQLFTETLSANHQYTGIAQIKLGRALVRQKRYAEAEPHTLAGYRILIKQSSPTVTWLQSARKDLVTIYDSLHEPGKAAEFRVTPVAGAARR
jgi:serine/threonine-protein kinase